MIGRTLGTYFALQFAKNVLQIYLLIFFLILAVDLTDQARHLGKASEATFSDILLVAFMRAPLFSEKVLPFATLFGSAITLIVLNRKLELVVARAAGVSVWQFLLPACLTAVGLGLFSMMIYNPLALSAADYGKKHQARVYGNDARNLARQTENFFVREATRQGDTIIRARVAQPATLTFTGVTLYRFDTEGGVRERIDAETATFDDQAWQLSNVTIQKAGGAVQRETEFMVNSTLTKQELQKQATRYDEVPFWSLRKRAAEASNDGLNALNFQTQFQSLLARPAYFIAMVLIAATVSLRFVRFGQNGKVILFGIIAGFVLYVASELVASFGRNGVVPPFVAVWSPASVAALLGLSVLLYQEDG
ncbi:MAG: LPS export ABC transporter permease LptG [Pseudomonadota bacterium]